MNRDKIFLMFPILVIADIVITSLFWEHESNLILTKMGLINSQIFKIFLIIMFALIVDTFPEVKKFRVSLYPVIFVNSLYLFVVSSNIVMVIL